MAQEALWLALWLRIRQVRQPRVRAAGPGCGGAGTAAGTTRHTSAGVPPGAGALARRWRAGVLWAEMPCAGAWGALHGCESDPAAGNFFFLRFHSFESAETIDIKLVAALWLQEAPGAGPGCGGAGTAAGAARAGCLARV